MKETYHIYTSTRYILRKLVNEDWNKLDILIFEHTDSHQAIQPKSYDELFNVLKNVDEVYSFDRVETIKHGAIAYDIIIDK